MNVSFANLTLITGGARSGKSALAERLALECMSDKVLYVATMPRVEGDDELDHRIGRHRMRRPFSWSTLEAESCLPERIREVDESFDVCIVDCLSLYISNMLFEFLDAQEIDGERQDRLSSHSSQRSQTFSHTELDALEDRMNTALESLLSFIREQESRQFIFVTNEVGWSVVPENGLARIYRDLLGFANQKMAGSAANVFLCCSGLELALKKGSIPRDVISLM